MKWIQWIKCRFGKHDFKEQYVSSSGCIVIYKCSTCEARLNTHSSLGNFISYDDELQHHLKLVDDLPRKF